MRLVKFGFIKRSLYLQNSTPKYSSMQISPLKKYRRLRNLTQAELAELSGISIKTIQRIESGISNGSPYTLKTLARTLDIDSFALQGENGRTEFLNQNIDTLKLLNLSALAVLILPLTNLIFPLIVFLTHQNNVQVNKKGRKILSFHILWIFITLVFMFVGYAFLWVTYPSVRGAQVPAYVPIYLVSMVVNIYFTIRTAIQINENKAILNFVPNLL